MAQQQQLDEEMSGVRLFAIAVYAWAALLLVVWAAFTNYAAGLHEHVEFLDRCEASGGRIVFRDERQSKGNYRQETYCVHDKP